MPAQPAQMKHQPIDKVGEGRGERMDRRGGGGEKEERRGEERGRQRNIIPSWLMKGP